MIFRSNPEGEEKDAMKESCAAFALDFTSSARSAKAYQNARDCLGQFDFFTEPPLLESVMNLSGFP